MSARIKSLVTADNKLRDARTMFPRFTDEQGSSANSLAAKDIASPVKQFIIGMS